MKILTTKEYLQEQYWKGFITAGIIAVFVAYVLGIITPVAN